MTEPGGRRIAQGLAWASATAMCGAWLLVGGLGDRVWWALPFLYGPRWAAGVLFLGLLPALLVARRTALVAGLLMAVIFAFGLLDVRLGLGRLEPAEAVVLRVLEINAGSGSPTLHPTATSILDEATRVEADIVVVAECSAALSDGIAASAAWDVRRGVSSVCIASHFPVLSWEERDPMDFWKQSGSGAIARATLATPAGVVRVGVVHLETPRDALDNFGDLSMIPTLGPVTRQNTEQRELESRVAREWIFRGEALPTIVAGDFNLPIESAIYRRHWSGLRNAFSRGGVGIGNTKRTRRWGIRIDHILTTDEFVTHHARIGRDVGSDHRPVSAELSLPKAQRTSAAR
ncbi:MAG: endonuclease/exonuclease/phosphatase family protein [Gemmatimonadetes bacterium]|nr:endonuclease/exonuclease/phosphatase family protein [Gemmatimonadota bacterium]